MTNINYQDGLDAGAKVFAFIHKLVAPVIDMLPGVSGNHQLHSFLGLTLSTQSWADLIVVALAIIVIGFVVGVIAKLLFGAFFRVLRIAVIAFIAFGALLFVGKMLGIGL